MRFNLFLYIPNSYRRWANAMIPIPTQHPSLYIPDASGVAYQCTLTLIHRSDSVSPIYHRGFFHLSAL